MIITYNGNIINFGGSLVSLTNNFQPTQLLVNPNFELMETDVKPLGWDSNVSFVQRCGGGCTNDVNPSISNNQLFFW
jgi:hypothetical protein